MICSNMLYNLCSPESTKDRNDVFYLVPERSCVHDSPVWYTTMPLGIKAITKIVNRLRPVREIQEAHLSESSINSFANWILGEYNTPTQLAFWFFHSICRSFVSFKVLTLWLDAPRLRLDGWDPQDKGSGNWDENIEIEENGNWLCLKCMCCFPRLEIKESRTRCCNTGICLFFILYWHWTGCIRIRSWHVSASTLMTRDGFMFNCILDLCDDNFLALLLFWLGFPFSFNPTNSIFWR